MIESSLYELLRHIEDPCGCVTAGTIKTEHQWMGRFALLNPGDCAKKTGWFRAVGPPEYRDSDMLNFAKFIIENGPWESVRPEHLLFNYLHRWDKGPTNPYSLAFGK